MRFLKNWTTCCAFAIFMAGAVLPVETVEAGRPASSLGIEQSLDEGGFSVDFPTAGSIRRPASAKNLLSNGDMEKTEAGRPKGWEKGYYFWSSVKDASHRSRILTSVEPLMHWESSEGAAHEGNRSMRLAIGRSAYNPAKFSTNDEICAYFHQSCALPTLDRNTKYVLLLHYRGHTDPLPNSRAYARITYLDDKGKPSRTYTQMILNLPSSEWKTARLQFVAPKSTRRLDVRLALTGDGELWLDDVSLWADPIQAAGPEVRLMPWHFLENTYCLSTADAGVTVFGFRNETGVEIDGPQLFLQLPEGVTILDMDAAAKIVQKRAVQTSSGTAQEYCIDIGAWKSRIRDGLFPFPFNMWEGLPLLLTTSRPAGPQRLQASYWLEDGEYRSAPLSFEIQIVPPIPAGTAPKKFRSGAHLFLADKFVKQSGIQAIAALYAKVGFNSVQSFSPCALSKEMGRLGIERYVQPLVNGYTMGDSKPGNKPPEAVFRLADGRPLWEAVCPLEVYRRGPYFRQQIENGILRKILVTDRSAEQIMANWEPHQYDGRGCFCDRCKEEFQTFSKLPAEEVDRLWPKLVVKEHHDLWLKFRAWQHGKLVTVLEEIVHALGKEAGLDSHFIPEIHYRQLTAAGIEMGLDQEYAAVEYLGKLPMLVSWAPYTWHKFDEGGPYDYVRGLHLCCHTSASEVREFVESRLPEGKRPRLIAFPYGTYEGATQPEALAFEFLTYYLDGYSGAFAYLFPGGYDARYWQAMAEANRLIALFEPFVMEGREVKHHRLICETPMPKPDPQFLSSRFSVVASPESAQRWKNLPLLLSWEFERGDKRLIAVGNFWERGECFFRLAPEGLNPAKRYVLCEPAAGRVYANRKGNVALTADQLVQEVLLHAGAMRYAFFVLESYRDVAYDETIIRPQDMEAAMRQRRPVIGAEQ